MHVTNDDILGLIRSLRTHRNGNRRAVHKPLLLLFAISRLLHGERSVAFNDVKSALDPLLLGYAPTVKGRHQPELPYWHLASDKLWVVDNAEQLARQASGFPTMSALRGSTAGFPADIADAITSDSDLANQIVRLLLQEHFPATVHDDLLSAFGLDVDASLVVKESRLDYASDTSVRRGRDPNFRQRVLSAYEYRCAFSGFRVAMNGQYTGCEAAHVQWHCYEGPDTIANGLALEPTVHKLFDIGAWSLTDDRCILVSRELTGDDQTIAQIRSRHGQPLLKPIQGEPQVNKNFIRWHREPDQGGVFRQPALPL